MGRPGYRAEFERARRALLASGPTCYWCGKRPATIADHDPPLAMFVDKDAWRGVLRASCLPCSLRQGGQLGYLGKAGGIRRRAARGIPPPSRPW